MSLATRAPVVVDDSSRRLRRIFAASAACGLAYGAFTYWVEGRSACPAWYEAWHGVVPWAVLTLIVGRQVKGPMWVAAVAGLLTQFGLVVSYYGIATLDWGAVSWVQVIPYSLMALVMGPIYGIGGTWLADRRTLQRRVTVVLAGAPFAIDGVNLLRETVDPEWTASHHQGALWTVTVSTLAIGVGVVWWLARTWRDRALAVAACTAIGYAFSHVVFHYVG